MLINVYPSQDNPTTQTLWIFSGSSTAQSSDTIRNSVNSNNYGTYAGDNWELFNQNIYNANKINDVNVPLSPLFSSSNTNDIASVRTRIPGGGRTNITFAANATNTPTITIASGNRTISHVFIDDDDPSGDDLGIRTASAFSYSIGQSSAWTGSGILNKPIGDFFAGTFNNRSGALSAPFFAANSDGSVRVVVNSQVIPEPEEYTLIFGLFALGFVLFHRRQMQRNANKP